MVELHFLNIVCFPLTFIPNRMLLLTLLLIFVFNKYAMLLFTLKHCFVVVLLMLSYAYFKLKVEEWAMTVLSSIQTELEILLVSTKLERKCTV